jgi:hypothetical protein
MNACKRTLGGLTTFAALMSVLFFSGSQAHASLSEFSFSHGFPVHELVEGVAIDESTDDVYAYDTGGIIFKFDADGNPVNFSGLGSNEITGLGGYGSGETELAVDNSSGPAKGDIYLAGGSRVQVFKSDGTKVGELTEVGGRPWGEVACGVAVDGSGDVYVGLYPSNINRYTPTANPVTNNDYTGSHSGFNEICEIAADRDGALYAATWEPVKHGPIVKLDNFQAAGTKEIVGDASGTLAVANSPSAELFFTRQNEILQYDPAGNQLSMFGAGEFRGYYTIAINAKNGRLYAFNADPFRAEARKIEIWQGVIAPEVRSSPATSLGAAGTATLNGTVNPEGVPVESCSFQYGSSVSYGLVAPCAQTTPLTGNSLLPVSGGVSGLALNHVYHYRLSVTDEHGTINGADQTFTILVLPTVEHQTPSTSDITRDSVRLTGTVNPKQGETRYRFEYGTTESYGNSTISQHGGDGTENDIIVSQQVADLIPNTTYHYRLVAENVAGTVEGHDYTFTTGAPTPPSAVTGGPSGVAQNSASVGGRVNTNGLPTSYGFEIGTTTDYGPRTGLGYVGAGLSEAPVSLALTGLVPGTTYHYRITATNVDGTSYGADQTFTTNVFLSTFAEPPAPLPFVSVPSIVFPGQSKTVVVKKKVKAKGKKAKKRRKAKGKKKPKNKKK